MFSADIWGLREKSYEERLIAFSATFLEYSRDTADQIVAYKVLDGLVDLSMGKASISLQKDVYSWLGVPTKRAASPYQEF